MLTGHAMLERRAPTIPYLDGWRGIAILLVLICHFGPRPGVALLGDLGVQMFFALSGYLMGEVLFVKKPPLTDFFFRRATRILPTFFLFVACMYVYAHFQARPYLVSLDELLATLFFARTYTPERVSIWNTGWAIGNIWSLNVEEHSYVFLAMLAATSRRLKNEKITSALLLASVAASLLFFCIYSNNPPLGDKQWQLRSECAAVGLLFSALLRQARGMNKQELSRDAWNAALSTLILGAILFVLFRFAALKVIVIPMVLAITVNYLDCSPGKVKNFLSTNVFMWFGKRSFSLYLWQQPFFNAVEQHLISQPVGLMLGIAVGLASFHFVEDPLRIMLNRAWTARQERIDLKHVEIVEQA
jgi:peptidoglycan/LPS O-acetylase OafA/YrhL